MILAFLQMSPAATGASPGLFDFFTESGPVAKLVLFILLTFSLISWSVLVGKLRQLNRAERHSREFLELFHQSQKFSEVNAAASRLQASPLVGLFQAGYAEIDSQIKAANPEGPTGDRRGLKITSLPSLERSLKRAAGVETQALARWTPFLATTAGATPFIGLFGTVWGIMVAFSQIGATGSTSIVTVAPGIAEALINTAAGLGAAIPALISYNYLAGRVRNLKARMEDFALELLNLAERNFT
ncbi:MAG TPA: MotA/TolQ/ExbB proton channel family protein [Thermoanaerobaculia bacterium]|nr:MotA/TolQ/ExbB proton channel family protein [Thermoanaerobaculia bacterium]